jgi:N-acetylglucosaminyldiphosphoundecaprenol N-acetyl-beta-D-mannosaminyltransferase
VRITPDTRAEALGRLERAVIERHRSYFCFCEANLLDHARRDPAVRRALDGAEAVYPDGVALTLLARIRGYPAIERIPGPTFILLACEYGLSRGWRHFFYGGGPGVADRLADNLAHRFAGLQVVGTYVPPFRPLTDAEEQGVKERIESSRADLVWIALGGPKQEFWVAERAGKLDVPVMLPVGAAFDFHSGNRPWAPAWVRRAGMEWVFRAMTGGPKTLIRNLRCVTGVAGLLARGLWQRLRHGVER